MTVGVTLEVGVCVRSLVGVTVGVTVGVGVALGLNDGVGVFDESCGVPTA